MAQSCDLDLLACAVYSTQRVDLIYMYEHISWIAADGATTRATVRHHVHAHLALFDIDLT